MARFSDEWLSELINKNDIVDVVSRYAALKESSGRHWALCPFHNEKTPSFSVRRDKQLFYCFGCRESGNVIHFIMKIEKLSFYEAVEYLANRVNMPMPKMQDTGAYEEKKRLREKICEINKVSALYYHNILMSQEGKQAFSYLENRGISANIIKRFGLGFSPNSFDALCVFLTKKGYELNDMKSAWLVGEKDSNVYDMFKNRIMFPIVNSFGKVIAFGGRVMDDTQPKYLNSSDTAAFNKRKNLYALNILKAEKQLKAAVLVEGYMDAIALNAAGVKGAVASLGTSFTAEQAHLLKRYVDNVYIAYDGDGAGRSAAQKAAEILEKAGLNAKVTVFPEGFDPDDYVKKFGIKGFGEKLKSSRTAVDFKLDMLKIKYDLQNEDSKLQYAMEASKIIKEIDGAVKKERYIKRLNSETGFSLESLKAQAGAGENGNSFVKYRYNSRNSEKSSAFESKAEQTLLLYIMNKPQYIVPAEKELAEGDFTDGLVKKVFYIILDRVKKGIMPVYAEIVSLLKEEDEIKKLSELVLNEIDDKNIERLIEGCINKIKISALERKRKVLLEQIKNSEGDAKKQLMNKLSAIDKDLYDKRSRTL